MSIIAEVLLGIGAALYLADKKSVWDAENRIKRQIERDFK